MTSRADVVQALADLYENPCYLEIGVYTGGTFHAVRAARKVAVDPKFRFAAEDRQATSAATYYETTSDIYFGELVSSDEKFDVIFLDGLHTFEQTLRDLLNSEIYLKPNGVIIIDDVLPNSYQASLRDFEVFAQVRKATGLQDPSWMGDVFRLVFFIDAFFQQYSFATVRENHGQLVLWLERREAKGLAGRSIEQISRLEYSDLLRNRDVLRLKTLPEIVELVRNNIATKKAAAV